MSLGVHVIVSSHPHVLAPHCMMHNKTFVAYSLGNFLFPPMRPVGGNLPVMLVFSFLRPVLWFIYLVEPYRKPPLISSPVYKTARLKARLLVHQNIHPIISPPPPPPAGYRPSLGQAFLVLSKSTFAEFCTT